MTAQILRFPSRTPAAPAAPDYTGARVSYEDMANPRRRGTVTGPVFADRSQWWITWDGAEGRRSSAFLPLHPGAGPSGWRLLPPESADGREARALAEAIEAVGLARAAKLPKPPPEPDPRVGRKYDRSLSTPQIAALVRAEVKAAQKTGGVPKGVKVSVRSRGFSGGSSIDVRVTALPAGFPIANRARVLQDLRDPHGMGREDLLSPECTALLATLERMLQAYNYDKSDAQTDYFHVNFYGHADVDWELRNADKERLLAEILATK